MKNIILFALCLYFLISPVYSESFQEYNAKQAKKQEEFQKEEAQKRKDYEQEQLKKYKKFKTKKQQEYDAYRRSVNEKFAEMMKKRWTMHEKKEAVPLPKSKEPPKPYIKQDDKPAPVVKLDYAKIVNTGSNGEGDPEPITPVDIKETEEISVNYDQSYSFIYHGTSCKARFFDSIRFSLPDISENAVAETWKKLSSEDFDILLSDCFNLKEELRLGDWGYIDLLRVMSEHFLGKESNEAVLLQMYILAQSGYKVRLAKTGGKLILLVPFRTDLYTYPYFVLDDDRKYYIIDKEARYQSRAYQILEQSFPREKTASLTMPGTPRLALDAGTQKLFQSNRYRNAFAKVQTNKNLIDFFNDYPVSRNFDDYAGASLSEGIKNTLYPALRAQINGKTKLEAANILLNFVQTAFAYKTDQEQFGYERPLFGDEIFYYPYSDCEDRSILFAIMVRELLGLDVVLLHYPAHLATAVNFGDEDVSGSYLNIDGRKYVISDPTYINAPVGECMPQFKYLSAEIIRL